MAILIALSAVVVRITYQSLLEKMLFGEYYRSQILPFKQ